MRGTETMPQPHPVLAATLGALLLVTAATVSTASPAAATTEPLEETLLDLTAPEAARIGNTATLRLHLRTADGSEPVGGAAVRVQRREDGDWHDLAEVTTDADGRAQQQVTVQSSGNTFRARWDGDDTHQSATSEPWQITATKIPTAVGITTGAGLIRGEAPVDGRHTDEAGGPLPHQRLRLERRVDGVWRVVQRLTTDAQGAVSTRVRVRVDRDDNVFRLRYGGSSTHAASVSPARRVRALRHDTVLTLTGPLRIVDETTVRLRLRWTAADGTPVRRAAVRIFRRVGRQPWKRMRTVTTNRRGRVAFRVGPRADTRWKAVGPRGTWWKRDVSNVHRLDNVPPGRPVTLPADAPNPRITLPPRSRAFGTGSTPRVTRIPNRVWRDMVGKSWHRGCPVGRPSLRLLRINYFGYDGYRYRGELVLHADVVGRVAAALTDLYANGYPLRTMHRVDRFGWSDRLRGADDYKSMAAGNTSAFNCRDVVGRPGRLSPHAYGRAIDINPWENPYYSRTDGWLPNSWWRYHSHPRVAWRSSSHPVVQILARHGLRWVYGVADAHHFAA